jgi:hypothetical protein
MGVLLRTVFPYSSYTQNNNYWGKKEKKIIINHEIKIKKKKNFFKTGKVVKETSNLVTIIMKNKTIQIQIQIFHSTSVSL